MSLYDFGDEFAQTYSGECECGNVVELSTQKDEYPEYQTEVYAKCQCCGRSVEFMLPVN